VSYIKLLSILFEASFSEEFIDGNIIKGLFYLHKITFYLFTISLFSTSIRNIKELSNPELWETFP
jgi:hypothetical protein